MAHTLWTNRTFVVIHTIPSPQTLAWKQTTNQRRGPCKAWAVFQWCWHRYRHRDWRACAGGHYCGHCREEAKLEERVAGLLPGRLVVSSRTIRFLPDNALPPPLLNAVHVQFSNPLYETHASATSDEFGLWKRWHHIGNSYDQRVR